MANGRWQTYQLPEHGPPFTNCDVDMFGPFLIKEDRKELKRYRALFTCLVSRAVDIECTCSMDRDSFMQALRRLIATRGNIRVLRSDAVSNFVGAQKELGKAFKEMNHQKIQYFLQNIGADYIIWCRNPPASSHMGGVWERQIRSTWTILLSLLNTHGRSLNDESLRTLLAETEAILNSRPLTVDTLRDIQSEQPLCVSNILTIKSKVVLPPPDQSVKADEFSRRRWRRIQHIANEFWARLRKDFLWSLQTRPKWNNKCRNFQKGDNVLLKIEANRNQWPMAKVIGVNADDMGFVRSVRLLFVSSCDSTGERVLERPIRKIVLIKEVDV